MRRALQRIAVLAVLAGSALAQDDVAVLGQPQVADPGNLQGDVERAPADEIQTLGEGDQVIHLARHGELWSIHAETVVAATLFKLWHEAGGPEAVSKIYLDYPFTLSLHDVPAERIVERVLEDYSFTLHYDAAGRLERVRVYSPSPSRVYRAPRLVENLMAWRRAEESRGQASEPAAAAPVQGGGEQ